MFTKDQIDTLAADFDLEGRGRSEFDYQGFASALLDKASAPGLSDADIESEWRMSTGLLWPRNVVSLRASTLLKFAKGILTRASAATVAEPSDTLPERDQSKPAEQQGLFRKFIVQRVDGSDAPGGKHHGCEYFVLDMTHDQHAAAALRAYAEACAVTHPQLSADLRARHGAAQQQAEPSRAFEYANKIVAEKLGNAEQQVEPGADERAMPEPAVYFGQPLFTAQQMREFAAQSGQRAGVAEDAIAMLKRLKQDLMRTRRFGDDTMAAYKRACSTAEGDIEEWLDAHRAAAPKKQG